MKEILIGKYRILEVIGQGGMGVVYRGEQVSLGRQVAIKTLPIKIAHDEEYLQRIENEARILAKFSHPNIVYIHDRVRQDDAIYLIMEYVPGTTVADRLKKEGPYSIEEAARIIIRVAVALEHAHSKGIIHRDIKPSNIIIRRDNVVKVTDFGIAKSSNVIISRDDDGQNTDFAIPKKSENNDLTRMQRTLGTRGYMSPEQAQARRDIDSRSDIYSLGIVFYLMVTGQLPPHPLPDRLPVFPPYYGRILKRCLAVDRSKRYQSVKVLIDALDEAKERFSKARKTTLTDGEHPNPATLIGIVLGTALLSILFIWQLDHIKAYTSYLFKKFFQAEHAVVEMKAPSENSTQNGEDAFQKVPQQQPEQHPGYTPVSQKRHLRPQSQRDDEIRELIDNKSDIRNVGDVRRFFSLKTSLAESNGNSRELQNAVQTLLERMDMVQRVDQGGCDLLIVMTINYEKIAIAIHSNLFGDDKTDSYNEHYSSTNFQEMLTWLETIVQKYYCFNLLRSMNQLNAMNDGYEAKVTIKGGANSIFKVGDKIEICLKSNRKAYSMLLSINTEGLYLLYPQTRSENVPLMSGRPLCSGPMTVSPPTGIELVAAVLLSDKSLFPIDNRLARDDQTIIESAVLPFDSSSDNALKFCETLFTRIKNIEPNNYAVYCKLIRTHG